MARAKEFNETHKTVTFYNIIDSVDDWKKFFDKQGIELYVLNQKSLLNKVLPVWKFS